MIDDKNLVGRCFKVRLNQYKLETVNATVLNDFGSKVEVLLLDKRITKIVYFGQLIEEISQENAKISINKELARGEQLSLF